MNRIAHILILLFIFISISCGKDYDEYIDETPQKKTADKDETSTTEDGDGSESGNDDEDNKKGTEKDLDDQEENDHNKSGESFDSNTVINGNNNVGNDGSDDETTNNNGENEDIPSDGGDNKEEGTCQDDENSKQNEGDNPQDETDNSADEEYKKPVFRIEKYMDLLCESGYSAQGGACYGEFFFQGYAGNKIITVYNLNTKKRIGSFETSGPHNSKIHVNTINFGKQRFDSNDEFPILYVSSGYSINGHSKIYAYRIQKGSSSSSVVFSFNLIQTITLNDFGSWTEGILDNENNCLWIKYEKSGTAGSYGYAKFNIPDITEGDVTIYFNDNSDNFMLPADPYPSSNQGHLFHEDRILLVSGVPSRSEKLAFISINTLTHERETIIDLAEAGLVNKLAIKDNAYEPEGCIFHEGNFMICYPSFIYTFQVNE